MKWKKVSTKIVVEHPRITLLEDIVELPNGDRVPYLKYEHKNDSATVICIKGDNVLLQKEYSYPPDEVLYQFPGGKIEPGESSLEGVTREMAEESGIAAGNIKKIGWFYVDNRRTSAKMHVYLATDCKEIKKQQGDIEEDISCHWTPISEVGAMIADGDIVNYSILSAWAIYRSYLTARKPTR